MAVIQKNIGLAGSRGSADELALFDSGSTYSCIEPGLAYQLGVVEPLPEPMIFRTAKDGETLRADEAVRLNFYIQGYRFSDEFMLIARLSESVIIGAAIRLRRTKVENEIRFRARRSPP